MISGHDQHFRRMYADEAQERLARLSSGAPQLRSGPDHASPAGGTVEEMVRDAHTLKGGALVVGFPHIARVAAALEDALDRLRQGIRPPPELPDAVTGTADGLRSLIARAVQDGHDDQASADALAARIAPALDRAAGLRPAVVDHPRDPTDQEPGDGRDA